MIAVETRRQASEEDAKWPVKAILRIISTVCAVIAAVLLSLSIAYANRNFINDDGNGDWTDGLALAPITFAILYNPLSLILHVIVRKGRHFHPAWHMLGDLIVWGLTVPAIIYVVAGGLFMYWSPAVEPASGAIDCGFYFNQWSPQCEPIAYTIGKMEIAATVFMFFVFIIHMTLFVYACIETHRRRTAANMSRVEKAEFELYNKDAERGPAPGYSP